ncbi:uncharacterized protein LOC129914007 [Episyrphus balteatus]|uniref:uncharacterized protein LOC129914007 n=1 Tax=Episyrphus balteatus TaxID=286459 RepID=UPI0024866A23|nr:uncharacterized protein LOC129914007 [Episyrphus balteatus]
MNDSMYANLPPEILINIFQYLDFYDLQAVKLSCKQWLAVTLLPEFEKNGVFKITNDILDSNHPAAEVIMNKQITNLYLKGVFIGEADELFQHLGTSLKALTLKLVPIDTALPMTMKYFPHLRYLKVSHIKMASLVGHIDWLISGKLTEMNKLILTSNDSIVNKYLLDSVENAESLKALTIEFVYRDETNILQVLAKHSKSLIELDLRYYEGTPLSASKWGDVFEKLKLTELSLQGNFHPDIVTRAIETQKSLRALDLKGSVAVDDNYLFKIGRKLPLLERLILEYCGRITNRGVNQLATLSHLKNLDLTGCNKLTSLSIHGIIGRTPNWSLMELHLQDVNIDESDVCFCANNLPNLRIFNLSGCGKAVTDKAIQEIFEFQRKLRALRIDNCKLTDNGILGLATGNSIQNLENLETLNLRSCKELTDLTLTGGLKIPQLKTLDISDCEKLTVLGLQGLIRNCPTIEVISISSGKGLGYEAVQILTSGLGRLRLLNVENCRDLSQVSAAGWMQTKFRPITNEVTLRRENQSLLDRLKQREAVV